MQKKITLKFDNYMKPKIIAFYLPQYHPTPHNSEWWGEGFTEWTNVAKAKSLFPGHYQPKIPADLGFYDLRLSEVRAKQAQLAKEAGVTAFCYYHYWFGNGQEELELPFKEVVRLGEPDFPFMLCWANESWYKKFWNNDGAVVDKKCLADQVYPGEHDDIEHFNSLLSAFKDPRYLKINGKLPFMIYKPLAFPEISRFIKLWQNLALQNDLPGFCFMGFTYLPEQEGEIILQKGLDYVVSCRKNRNYIHNLSWAIRKLFSIVFHLPRITDYRKLWPTLITDKERKNEKYIPTMMPNWDHTPRSGINGDLFTNSTPEEFEKHCVDVLEGIVNKKNNICFIKSWNEWGEGNYMEPDMKYGHGYINALKNALNRVVNKNRYNVKSCNR